MQLIPYRDVILVKNSASFWAKAVKHFLSSEYSHSEYVVHSWLTFGTDLKRPASIHTFGYNLGDIDIFRYKWEITSSQKDIITEELQKSTNLSYDALEALFLGLGIKHKGKNNRYICISLILSAMEKAGMLPKGIAEKYTDFSVFTDGKYFQKM